MMSSTIAATQTAVKRASIGTCVCSYAYFKANAIPKNRTTTPTRTTVLPPMNQRQMKDGSRGARDARWLGAVPGAAGLGTAGLTRAGATGSSTMRALTALVEMITGETAGAGVGAGG